MNEKFLKSRCVRNCEDEVDARNARDEQQRDAQERRKPKFQSEKGLIEDNLIAAFQAAAQSFCFCLPAAFSSNLCTFGHSSIDGRAP